MKRAAVLFIVWTVIALPSAGAQREELLTVDHAVRIALENNRTVRNSALELEKARSRVAVSRTRRLPEFSTYTLGSRQLSHVDLLFEKGSLGLLDGVGPVPAEDTTIRSPGRFSLLVVNEITQPLSQLHRINLGVRQNELGVRIAEQQLRSDEHAVAASVKSAYYAILQTQSSLSAYEQSIRLYRELDRLTEQYVLQRVSLRTDSLDVKTRLAKSELEALALEDLLASQKEQLNALLGRSLAVDFAVEFTAAPQSVSMEIEEARQRALSQRPEVRQAKLRVDQAETDRRSKRAEFIPDVSFSFSNTSPINYSDVLPKNVTTMGISLKWEPFDWGRKKHELADKDTAVRQASNVAAEAESAVLREVNAGYRKLQRSVQTVRVAELAQETAAESLRVTVNGYKADAALLKDVLQSESAMEQANDQYRQALLSFLAATAEFEKSLGEDHE